MDNKFEGKPTVSRVLLATDFSEPSQAAFRACLELCGVLRANLYILNVYEYANMAPPESGGLLLEYQDFLQDAESSLETFIENARQHRVATGGAIGTGVASACILDHERGEGIDLIVLGTRSIHGFERLVFGSTAEAVLRKASCPVLTVGPQASPRTLEMKAAGGMVVFATDFHATTTAALKHAASFACSMGLPLH